LLLSWLPRLLDLLRGAPAASSAVPLLAVAVAAGAFVATRPPHPVAAQAQSNATSVQPARVRLDATMRLQPAPGRRRAAAPAERARAAQPAAAATGAAGTAAAGAPAAAARAYAARAAEAPAAAARAESARAAEAAGPAEGSVTQADEADGPATARDGTAG